MFLQSQYSIQLLLIVYSGDVFGGENFRSLSNSIKDLQDWSGRDKGLLAFQFFVEVKLQK